MEAGHWILIGAYIAFGLFVGVYYFLLHYERIRPSLPKWWRDGSEGKAP